MQVFVETFHDVRERIDVSYTRLRLQEVRERFEMLQVLGIAYTAAFKSRHRELNRIEAEVINGLVGFRPELDTLIEVLGPLIVQVDARNEGNQQY